MNTPIKTTIAAALTSVIMHVSPALADDVSDIKAASAAFYEALKTLDDGTAVANTFAEKPYVTYVGPLSKDIIVGWPALKTYMAKVNSKFAKRDVQADMTLTQVNGSVAWQIGHEHGELEMKDGNKNPVDWVATNIFEKQSDGRWLMVSHHVQPGVK
jgi:ketosteroid isomerase-like protein